MKLVFFRTPKPRSFSYTPRYFDEDKERSDQRKRELGISNDSESKQDLRTRMSQDWKRYRGHDKTRQKSIKMSLFIYLVIAAMLIYFIFFV
ncbi:MAG: hypothetical protein K8R53_00265 [Bacteroidales bacterium]|nr:hypothetical protein [Bacteroidales bacterium]